MLLLLGHRLVLSLQVAVLRPHHLYLLQLLGDLLVETVHLVGVGEPDVLPFVVCLLQVFLVLLGKTLNGGSQLQLVLPLNLEDLVLELVDQQPVGLLSLVVGLQLPLIALSQELGFVVLFLQSCVQVVDLSRQGGLNQLSQTPHVGNAVLSLRDELGTLTVAALVAGLLDRVDVVAQLSGQLLQAINLLVLFAFDVLKLGVKSVLNGFFHGDGRLQLVDLLAQLLLNVPVVVLEVTHLLIVPLL